MEYYKCHHQHYQLVRDNIFVQTAVHEHRACQPEPPAESNSLKFGKDPENENYYGKDHHLYFLFF